MNKPNQSIRRKAARLLGLWAGMLLLTAAAVAAEPLPEPALPQGLSPAAYSTLSQETPPAELRALAYQVDSGTAQGVPDFHALTEEYQVLLPAETPENAEITLVGEPHYNGVSITENPGVTLSGGSGEAEITVTAEDGSPRTYRVAFTTAAPAPDITTVRLPDGNEDQDYAGTLAATGLTPITWSVTEGSLPDGLRLNKDTGEITGVTEHDGAYPVTIQATNERGRDSAALTITVHAAHRHPECGGACTHGGPHQELAWTVLTQKNFTDYVEYHYLIPQFPYIATPILKQGNYCLGEDIDTALVGLKGDSRPGRLLFYEYPGGTARLCLNGHTLSDGKPEKYSSLINNQGSLTVCDCGEGGTVKGKTTLNGPTQIYGGAFRGANPLALSADSVVTMWGGEVTASGNMSMAVTVEGGQLEVLGGAISAEGPVSIGILASFGYVVGQNEMERCEGSVTLRGGSISAEGGHSRGVLQIGSSLTVKSGAKISAYGDSCIGINLVLGKTDITGGELSAAYDVQDPNTESGGTAFWNEGGIAEISGGTFTAGGHLCVAVQSDGSMLGDTEEPVYTTVTAGTFSANGSVSAAALAAEGGTLILEGGTYSAKGEEAAAAAAHFDGARLILRGSLDMSDGLLLSQGGTFDITRFTGAGPIPVTYDADLVYVLPADGTPALTGAKAGDTDRFYLTAPIGYALELRGDQLVLAKQADAVGTVTGKVTQQDGSPAAGVQVTLSRGGETIDGPVTTNESGAYSFQQVPAGDYTVTASLGDSAATALVSLYAHQVTADLVLPAEKIKSTVKTGPGAPSLAAGGLDAVAAAAQKDAPGSSVTVTLTGTIPEAPEGKEAIEALANQDKDHKKRVGLYLDFSLVKTVNNGAESEITDTGGNLLEIVVPFDFTGKKNVTVYRYHDGKAQELNNPYGEDGSYWRYPHRGTIHICAGKYSTYAIAYDDPGAPPAPPPPAPAGDDDGGDDDDCALTATAGQGGAISPKGRVYVARNGRKTFTITPEEGYVIADVQVDGESVGAVGTYTFEKVTGDHTIAAAFRAESPRPAWNPFADVGEGDWFYDSVKYVYERGLMNGTEETRFSPDRPITRGMIAAVLWRLEGEPAGGGGTAFSDVAPGRFCHQAVLWGAAQGIIRGYDDGAFRPDDPITRQQLAAILYRYGAWKGMDMGAAGDLTAFADRPDPWAEDAVRWAVGSGILNGRDGALDPHGQATRAQAAAMLARFAEVLS